MNFGNVGTIGSSYVNPIHKDFFEKLVSDVRHDGAFVRLLSAVFNNKNWKLFIERLASITQADVALSLKELIGANYQYYCSFPNQRDQRFWESVGKGTRIWLTDLVIALKESGFEQEAKDLCALHSAPSNFLDKIAAPFAAPLNQFYTDTLNDIRSNNPNFLVKEIYSVLHRDWKKIIPKIKNADPKMIAQIKENAPLHSSQGRIVYNILTDGYFIKLEAFVTALQEAGCYELVRKIRTMYNLPYEKPSEDVPMAEVHQEERVSSVAARKIAEQQKELDILKRKLAEVEVNSKPAAASSKDEDENLCVVCQDAPKVIAVFKCAHLAYCTKCVETANKICAICRQPFESYQRIYNV